MKPWEGRLIIRWWKVVIIPLSPTPTEALPFFHRSVKPQSNQPQIQLKKMAQQGGCGLSCMHLFIYYTISALLSLTPPSTLWFSHFSLAWRATSQGWTICLADCHVVLCLEIFLFLSLLLFLFGLDLFHRLDLTHLRVAWVSVCVCEMQCKPRRLAERSVTPDIFRSPIDFLHSLFLKPPQTDPRPSSQSLSLEERVPLWLAGSTSCK